MSIENPNTPEFWDNYYQITKNDYEFYKRGKLRYNILKNTINTLRKSCKKKIKILDFGCGNGYVTMDVPKDVEYLGVDFSNIAIEICKKKFPYFKFEIANLEDYKIEENFDMIFLIDILEHLSNPHKILKKAIEHGKIIVINSPYKGEIQALDHINKIDMDFFEEYLDQKREISFRIFNTPDGRSVLVVIKND